MEEFKTIEELVGKTITKEEHWSEEAILETSDGLRFQMYHSQDCCETVTLDKIEGDINQLLNHEVTKAEEIIGHEPPPGEYYESVTFTDFRLTTAAGSVTFKWTGSSNGYYSESVYFVQI